MARKLTGSIEYRDGRWRVRVKGEYIGTYSTEAQAIRARDKAASMVRERERAPMTLARFGKSWLDQRERDGVSGMRQERSNWSAHIVDSPIATLPLRSVRPKHVADWLSDLAQKPASRVKRYKHRREWVTERVPTGEPLSRATVRRVLTLAYLAFEGARIAGHVSRNPADRVQLPRMRRRTVVSHQEVADSPQLVQFLTLDEIAAVLSHLAGDPEWQSLYAVAIYGGLRKGELLALRWEDLEIDGEHPHIRVRRSNGFRGLKSAAGARDVPLLLAPLRALRAWRVHRGVQREFGPVWPTRDGTMRRPGDDLQWPDKRYRKGGKLHVQERIRSLAGVRPEIRFHDLRHTCASHLVQGTWTAEPLPLRAVAKWLGHSHTAVTEGYAHLAPNAIRRHAKSPAGDLED